MPRRQPAKSRRWRFAPALVLVAALAVSSLPFAAPGPVGAAPDPDGCFVQRSYQVFLGRDGTASEIWGYVAFIRNGMPRSQVPATLSTGDEWLRAEVTALYQQALDRNPDPDGLAYWAERLRRGVLVNAIAAQIYGSGEFYRRAGSTTDGFITDLYDRILHRAPDSAGLAFWRSEIGTRGRARVAGDFFASIESRRDRVTRLYQEILGRAPDGPGREYWAGRLRTTNDVRLAASLASTAEFYERAQVGCELPPPPPPGQVTFTGHGWGHGRGMGQYGALGYAVDHGWNTDQILNHFYGGTTKATQPTDAAQRVYLTGSAGRELVVQQDDQILRVDGYGADVRAVRIARVGANSFRVWRGTGCNGPWTEVGVRGGPVRVWSRVGPESDTDTSRLLQHCVSGGVRYYRGDLSAVEGAVGGTSTIRTVNTLAGEKVLRSIVPKEMPASWASLGGGAGAHALRAQAVAARSYMLSPDSRWGSWATTCDSTQCQVYRGYGFRAAGTTALTREEHPLSDAAITATARQVRRHTSGGAIARTEFSSSTGGWTAGGTFPAVVDAGDDISSNSRHTWTVTKTADQVEADIGGGRGDFVRFDQWSRNGLGDMGGRVLTVRAVFTGGSVTLTGEQVRSALGLNSNWFTV